MKLNSIVKVCPESLATEGHTFTLTDSSLSANQCVNEQPHFTIFAHIRTYVHVYSCTSNVQSRLLTPFADNHITTRPSFQVGVV